MAKQSLEQYKQMLRSAGLKATYQRAKVLEYLDQHCHDHPTIDQIHHDLLAESSTFSKTSVYNIIQILKDKGLISTLEISGKEIRCDAVSRSHHHFLCKRCGVVYDVDIPCQIAEKRSVDGHKVEEVHGYFRGICRDCLPKST